MYRSTFYAKRILLQSPLILKGFHRSIRKHGGYFLINQVCKSCIFLCGSNAIFLLTETVWKNVVRIIYITGKDRTVYREAVDQLGCKSLC